MYDVITIGSALVDIFIHSQNFLATDTEHGKLLCQAYGDKIEVDNFNVYTGGGASNTAVGFARMGFETGIICETGRDRFSYLVMEDLRCNGVHTDLIIEEKREQTGGSVILVGHDGERTVMVHRGASSMLDSYDIPSYWLSQTRWIHLSSIGGRQETLKKIFKLVKRDPQVKLSWNPGSKELALLRNQELPVGKIAAHVVAMNQTEWEMIAPLQSQLLQHIPQLIITAGKRGGEVYLQGQHAFHFNSSGEAAVDTTGAGDSFTCGYVSGLLMGQEPQQAAQVGVANAGSVVKYYGAKAGLLSREQLK